ncbi:right-handed parallel beta-helix repeat-containing protein [Actinoallomurus soli]|uniref:right-handed parallel beta-helix repeat-containing protein n=1 Tax=Actinoallomurus soli TaxID=2952535 RepID=UPI0020932B9E|nr:right-handed parallel beta-helix repeat-containing protein [Actinoallomurus soli]MCO5968889.1 right-handed parallel beta-helix repeat-containing protein [Actinoallomurus soli]
MKIDLKFVSGLVVGALLVAGLTWLLAGGRGGSSPARHHKTASRLRPVPASSPAGGDGGDGGDAGASAGPEPDLPVPTGAGKIACPSATRTVDSADALQSALEQAKPGDVITLSPGTYQGKFATRASGTADRPISLCGDASAILDGGGIKKGYAFHLDHAAYWHLIGFSVQNSQKGVMADGSNGSVIQGLTVHDIGDEAIHLRDFSTGNTVQYNKIWGTGRRRAKFGEGVYLGSAESNWSQVSGGKMDKSDHNVVRGNVIQATAEAVDIKEGTTGGRVIGNVFDGSNLGGDKHNDSWVDVKGNDYVLQDNTGTKTPADGFQTHQIIKGWGTGNVFRGNTIDLAGGNGVGINDTAGGNTILCDNKVSGGRLTENGKCVNK